MRPSPTIPTGPLFPTISPPVVMSRRANRSVWPYVSAVRTLRSLLVPAALLQSCVHAAAPPPPPPRELVHPFPPGGLTEVIGATRASRTLRAMQRYASPAFTDLLAA